MDRRALRAFYVQIADDRLYAMWRLAATRSLHGLRHSHATHMLEAGVNVKIVAERLGHSSIAITGDVYSHVTANLQDEAAARAAAVGDGDV